MKLNLLYLTNIFSDTVGGSEYVFWLYAKYLARKDHNIYVMCFRYDKRSLPRIAASNLNIVELAPEAKHRGVLFQDLKTNLKYLRKGLQILKDLHRDIELVHSNTYIPVLLGGFIKTLYKRKHVVTIHDIGSIMGTRFLCRWFREGGNNVATSFIKSLISVAYENTLVNIVPKDTVIVPSLQSKLDVERISLLKDEIYVIPNFIDTEFYGKYKSRFRVRYEPCLLYIGRLVFYKNVHMLLKTFNQVLQHRKDAKLFIIGKGPLGELLHSYVHRRGLNKNVIILNDTTQEKKCEFLSRCSAMLNLSMFEGFGITILESWYFEKPVIVSNVPPLNELVENGVNGYIVDPRGSNILAELMLRLLDDPKLAQKMGSKGLSKVLDHYSPESVVPHLESVYEAVIIKQ